MCGLHEASAQAPTHMVNGQWFHELEFSWYLTLEYMHTYVHKIIK